MPRIRPVWSCWPEAGPSEASRAGKPASISKHSKRTEMKHKTEPRRDQTSPRGAGLQVEKLSATPTPSECVFSSLSRHCWEAGRGSGCPLSCTHKMLVLGTVSAFDAHQPRGRGAGGSRPPGLPPPLPENLQKASISRGLLRVALLGRLFIA